MIQEVSAVRFRQNLGAMIARVQYNKDAVVINKSGKAAAVLVDPELFERIKRLRGTFDALTDKLATAYGDVEEEKGIAEIDNVVTSLRDGSVR
ncbi:MAG: type II toxin-antitoxin system Phd/YefM family antitoxin [Coriobacteriales bacterium]|jgi:prevent-host-death family protein|nr:type II toxin-antitoxin system Phd/YefM family antitoxin [Coriobacteriales bacterium]